MDTTKLDEAIKAREVEDRREIALTGLRFQVHLQAAAVEALALGIPGEMFGPAASEVFAKVSTNLTSIIDAAAKRVPPTE